MKLSLDGQTRHRRSRWQRCAVRVVVGEQDRQIKPAGPVLLCERALWPGEANAQPPVSGGLIGGAGWDYADLGPVPGFVGCEESRVAGAQWRAGR